MTAGVAAKPAFNYGWHTYSWSTYNPPVDTQTLGGGPWNAFSITIDSDPSALAISGKTNYNGTVTVKWGTRPGAYDSQSAPIPVTAGNTFNYRMTGLKRNRTYYANGYASLIKPASAGVYQQSVLAQYGEVSQATS